MEAQQYISMASVALAALMALFGGFRYVTAQVEGLRREIVSAEEKARLLIDKAIEHESKQRHASNNNVQIITSKIENEIRQIQRETVRHEQMDALEARVTNALSKIEAKVDRLAETAGEIAAIKQNLAQVTVRLDKLLDRLETAGHNTRI